MELGIQIKGRLLRVLQPGAGLDAQNAWALYGDGAWYGVLIGVAGAFLTVFVIRVGGSDLHVGLLSALPALITFLVSQSGGRLVERGPTPRSILIVTALLNRLGYFFIALIPLLLTVGRADAIVLTAGLLTVPGAIFNIAFIAAFAGAVGAAHRARVVSNRSIALGLTSTLIALVGGRFLDLVPFPINYQILFAASFAASMMSVYYLARLRLPKAYNPVAPADSHAALGLLETFRRSRAYARFTTASFVFHWGSFFVVPLYSIYWVRILGATDGWVGLLSMVGTAFTIVFYPLWGRLTTRRGNAYGVVLTAMGLSVYPVLTALSPAIEWIIPLQLIAGVTTSGYGITFFNRLLETSPEEHRPSYIAGYNTLINMAAFIGPFVATSMTSVLDIRVLLIIGAVLRFLGSLLFWRQLVPYPRP